MTRQEFARAVQALCVYFGQDREPAPAQLDAWFEVLREADGGAALDHALARIKAEEAFFPKNLPRALLEHLPRPRPRAQKPAHCPDCGGRGLLHGRMLGPDGRPVPGLADYSFRCGRCLSPDFAGSPAALLEDLPGLGFAPRP